MKVLRRSLPFLLLGGAAAIFFWSILAGKKFMWEDIMYMYYPYHYFLFGALKVLSIPLWNPYVYSGMPFLGDIQSQAFYPLNWLLAQFTSTSQTHVYWLVEFKAILHIVLAGVGMFAFMRQLKLSKLSSLFAGVAFMFSGFMVTHLIHLTMVSTFAWFPLILLFFHRVFVQRRHREAVLAGLAIALANLAGHPQMTLYMISALVLLFALFVAFGWKEERGFLLKGHLPAFGGLLVLGFALSAAAYLPAFMHSKYTLREMMTYSASSEVSLPWCFPLRMLVPKFFGSVSGPGTDTVKFWGGGLIHVYWETALYVGVLPLVFAAFAVVFDRSRERVGFIVLGAVALLAALGKYTPFYRLLFELAPGFDRFRIPARFVSLFGFSLAALAGLGMERFTDGSVNRKRLARFTKWFGIVVGVLAVGWVLMVLGVFRTLSKGLQDAANHGNATLQSGIALFFLAIGLGLFFARLRGGGKSDGKFTLRQALPVVALLVLFVDLYRFGSPFNPANDSPERFFRRDRTMTQLQQARKKEVFRVNGRDRNAMLLRRNEGMVQGLELLEGYTPLKLANYVSFNIPIERQADILNAKFKIAIDSVRKKMMLVPNPTYLPRAKMYYRWEVEPDSGRALAMLRDPTFDYREVLVVDREPPEYVDRRPGFPELQSTVKVLEQSGKGLRISVKTTQRGLLFVSEVYYPRWKARIDGEETEIMVANHCLRAVPVEPGEHEVEFYYDDPSVTAGALISTAALAVCIGFVVVGWRRRGKKGRAGSRRES